MPAPDLDAAVRFLHATGRLLERHRLARLLGGAAEPVLQALRAYRNLDGGFGHAIEPDLRAPDSQPVGVQTAMEILHEAGIEDDPMVGPACDFLAGVARADGGVPFALPSAMAHPRSPIWQAEDASSLIQTAANAAALHALGVEHPWLDGATAFCLARIAALDLEHATPSPGLGYEARFSAALLDVLPEAGTAEAALERLMAGVRAAGLYAREPGGDVQTALDFSPWPGSRTRAHFSADEIERDLDFLAQGQKPDGGWTFGWPAWNDAATCEWRGVVTVQAVRVLRANGRL